MPTLFELAFGKIKVSIYFKDHNPPHVHARAAGAEAVFLIDTMQCIANHGFDHATIRRIQKVLVGRHEYLAEKWDEYKEG